MLELRHIAAIVGVVAAVVMAIGINRVVVSDGHIPATAATAQLNGLVTAFKSDYFPLEK